MNGQDLPVDDLPVGAAGLQLAGKRFGLMIAMRVVSKSRMGNRWLMQCDCGRFAVRRVAHITRAIREGQEPMCTVCLGELRAGMGVAGRSRRRSVWVSIFLNTGSLWPERAEERIRDEIRSEIAERLQVPPPVRRPPVTLPAAGFGLSEAMGWARRELLDEYRAGQPAREERRAAREATADADLAAELAHVRAIGRAAIAVAVAKTAGVAK